MNSINYGEIEKAIGRVAIYFSSLENTISRVIGLLISEQDTEIGDVITSELSFKQLVGMLQNIFKHKSDSEVEIKKLDKILYRAIKISDERNAIIHSLWLQIPGDSEEYIRLKKTAKHKKNSKGVQRQNKIINPLEIYKIADEIHELEGAIYQFEIDRSF